MPECHPVECTARRAVAPGGQGIGCRERPPPLAWPATCVTRHGIASDSSPHCLRRRPDSRRCAPLSYALEVTRTTLVSRFARRGLPSPKLPRDGSPHTRRRAVGGSGGVDRDGRHPPRVLLSAELRTPSPAAASVDAVGIPEGLRRRAHARIFPHDARTWLPARLRTFSPLAPPAITPASANGVRARGG